MPEILPHYEEGNRLTLTVATTAVVGGQVVAINGNMTCAPAGADSTAAIGVAAHDAAIGALVTVYRVGVFDLTATGAIGAGEQIACAAAGTVKTIGAGTAFTVIGRALEAIANGAAGRVALTLT